MQGGGKRGEEEKEKGLILLEKKTKTFCNDLILSLHDKINRGSSVTRVILSLFSNCGFSSQTTDFYHYTTLLPATWHRAVVLCSDESWLSMQKIQEVMELPMWGNSPGLPYPNNTTANRSGKWFPLDQSWQTLPHSIHACWTKHGQGSSFCEISSISFSVPHFITSWWYRFRHIIINFESSYDQEEARLYITCMTIKKNLPSTHVYDGGLYWPRMETRGSRTHPVDPEHAHCSPSSCAGPMASRMGGLMDGCGDGWLLSSKPTQSLSQQHRGLTAVVPEVVPSQLPVDWRLNRHTGWLLTRAPPLQKQWISELNY